MEITLGSESATRIRAVLGDDIDLSPAAVPRVLARLAEESPALYSEVLGRLSGSDVRLDSERTLHRRHHANALRRALLGWGEYESEAGDRLLAKRRVAAAVPLALAILMLVLGGISSLLHRPSRGPAAHVSAGRVAPAGLPARSERTTTLRPPALEGFQWPPRPARTAFAPIAEPAAPRTISQLPPLPALPVPGPVGFRLVGPPPPSIVFSRTQTPTAGSDRGDVDAPRSPVVYARDISPDSGQPSEPRSASSPELRATSESKTIKVGDRVPAQLVTALIVAAGTAPVPVVAQGTDGSTWLGYAGLEPDRRIHILFRAVDRTRTGAASGTPPAFVTPSNGVALDRERMSPGLPGRVVIRRGATAAAAIAAVAQAASEYVQAVARAGQFTVSDGGTQISVGAPAPAWTYAASHFADMLNPQTARVAIETFELDLGTPCYILITGAP